jgi:hypothetical protein
MRVPRCHRLRRRDRAAQPPTAPVQTVLLVTSIMVSDDGFSVTGRRYAGFIAEVRKRQEMGEPQEVVTVWHPLQDGYYHTAGLPRINNRGELEVLDPEDNSLRGTVREMDGSLCFLPA